MNFKNDLERHCFEIAKRALGDGVSVDHNKRIKIENALCPEVASFKGPPTKEIDVLTAELCDRPKVVLLVSCKLLGRKAEPAHVQEWCAVVRTMNAYSEETLYFGLVVSPTGFSSGCEAWAMSYNLGILPPLKGRKLVFGPDAVFRMFERVLLALRRRLQLKVDDLKAPPAFFDFVYRLVADFEGHQEMVNDGRYMVLPQKWASSFGEMYSAIGGRRIEDLYAVTAANVLKLSGGIYLRLGADRVQFGGDSLQNAEDRREVDCSKNIEMEPCTLEFIKSVAVGKSITSACDFGTYIEVGLNQRFNLGIHQEGFRLVSTEIPITEYRL